jgi:hypothetical protein
MGEVGQTKAKMISPILRCAIIGNTLYFAGDRTSNNGDAQIGFWFYLNGTGPVTQTDGTRNFAPEHAVGDILVLADFTGGGGTATTTVYKWVGDGTGNVPNTNGNLQTVDCPNAIVAENNGASYPHPNEFSFDSPCYAPNEFYEGAIPLSCIANATGNICFSSYLLETRSSQSITASLDDFVANSFTVAPTAVLTGGTITCTNPTVTLSTAGSSAGTYLWTGPGSITNSTSINASTSTSGVYTLRVTNSTGCTATATASVSVNTTAPGATATGGLVTCTTTSTTLTGGPAGFNYAWTGPGGFTSAVQSPTGVTAAGVYTLRVTNPANGCTSTATASVTANTAGPGATATGGLVTCTTTSTTLTGGPAGFNYAWTGPGGFTSAVQSPTGVTAAGTYTLVVTNPANGCTSTATASVTVNNTPPGATATGGLVTCTNTSTTLAGGPAGFNYAWTGPGGFTSAVQSPTGVTAAGTYTLVVTNPANGCTSTATASVTVNNTPPGATATGGLVTCTTTSTTLTGGPAGFNYAWTGPGGFTSAVQSPTGVTAAGVYTLRVTNPANGCTSTATASVTVNADVPGATATGGLVTCTTTSTTLTGGPAGFNYAWTGPGGFTSAVQSPTGVTAAGVYTLRVTNPANGCTSTATASVTVNNTPPGATATGGLVTCTTTSTTLTGGPAGFNYAWTGPGGFTSAVQSPTGVTAAGTYTLVVTNPANGCTSTATASVTVNNTPPGATATGGLVTCTTTSTTLTGGPAGFNYAWTGPGGFTSAVQSPTGVTAAGVYTLRVTNPANGCTSTATASVTVNADVPGATATGGLVTCTNNIYNTYWWTSRI